MKILLSLVICSYVQGVCMPAYEWPEQFNTMYDCLTFGYEESNKKIVLKLKKCLKTILLFI